jgi:ParB-like chromosome segregation protein Spo0J
MTVSQDNLFSKQKEKVKEAILTEIKKAFIQIESLDLENQIDCINMIRFHLHEMSPFKNEPVDIVQWIPADQVRANDYNPNIVAPPEMKLLTRSIEQDGYTQPIVAWKNCDGYEVVDGFHRNRIGKENPFIRDRINNYLPLTIINQSRSEKGDRIASTIRHNRARGKHTVEGMSDIILELKNRNWTNERIAKNLGMDEDEILRLCQITGLAGLFSDQEFSKSWEIEDSVSDFEPLSDDPEDFLEEEHRVGNTNDENRIFHTHDKWECEKSGLYKTTVEDLKQVEAEQLYADFLSDSEKFRSALHAVITEWKHSCEHYLTNTSMNRIAWLGQASVCYALKLPAVCKGGFNFLSDENQLKANNLALEYLNKWLVANNREEVTLNEGLGNKQVDLY